MVIFFSEPTDISTRKIIEWVLKFNSELIIVNEDGKHFISLNNIIDEKIEINVNNTFINANNICAVYYRRSGKKSKLSHLYKNKVDLNSKAHSLLNYVYGNEITKNEILAYLLNNKRVFGTENIGRTNKILALVAAKKAGLKTPESIFTGSKNELIKFKKIHKKIICKSMDVGFKHTEDNYTYMGYTNLINESEIRQLQETFSPTLFQNYIEKEFEIRCFWFHGNFYAIAFFSQNNTKTKIDYRRYDDIKPNRQVPITIPNELKSKINLLFKYLNLNTGSLDIIVNGNDYYFLEVNPVGIFDNVSGWGNWYIERDIAKYLIGNEK